MEYPINPPQNHLSKPSTSPFPDTKNQAAPALFQTTRNSNNPLQQRWSNESAAMSSPASTTPDHAAPAAPNVRRSFTVPAKIANRPQPTTSSADSANGIETLFTTSSTKIVSFVASSPASQASDSRRQSVGDGVGALSWKSPTERTMAVGVLRIYRVTSSNVSFLNSGNLLHTIFPRSQCWCVDGQSIFVLRVRQDSYYRIELPYESEEDKQTVEEFKSVLGQVLHFEKTRCPFKAEVDMDLPERPKTPPRRRLKRPSEKAKKWLFDKNWVPEDGPTPTPHVLEGSDSGTTSSVEEDDRSSINTDTHEAAQESPGTMLEVTPPKAPPTSVLERAKTFQLRSVTAPSGFGIGPPPNSKASILEPEMSTVSGAENPEPDHVGELRDEPVETLSLISSTDSFYSLTTTTQRSPSPPYIDAETGLVNSWLDERSLKREQEEERGRGRHRRQVSDLTVRQQSSEHANEPDPETPTVQIHPASSPMRPASAPSTPPLVSDSEEDSPEPPFLDVPTPPDTLRMRRLTGASQRRAFSPMPQPQNLFSPPTRGRGKQFTAALVRKTCELLIGPPAHLVSLMLNIAARISDGLFGFNTYRVRHAGERLPCSWESDEDEWTEDDFGIPLGNLEGSTLRRRNFLGELD